MLHGGETAVWCLDSTLKKEKVMDNFWLAVPAMTLCFFSFGFFFCSISNAEFNSGGKVPFATRESCEEVFVL